MTRPTHQRSTTSRPASGAGDAAEIQRLVEDLDEMLSRLRLGAIRERLDALLEEASRRQLNLREALAWLCAAEVASKEQRRLSMAMTIARFPFVRTLEGFEFEAQPSIDPGKVRDLATCRWVANGDNVVLLGPPGVGKTHLEVALGREAVARGYSVQFTTAMELLGSLLKAQQQGMLEARLAQYAKPKLLIVDELGYLPLEPQGCPKVLSSLSSRHRDVSQGQHSLNVVGQFPEALADRAVASSPQQVHGHRAQEGEHRHPVTIGVAMGILTELDVAGPVPLVLNAPALADQS